MTPGHAGWLTLHEVLEATGLPYQRIVALTEDGVLTSEPSGSAELYEPDAVRRVAADVDAA